MQKGTAAPRLHGVRIGSGPRSVRFGCGEGVGGGGYVNRCSL